MKNKKYFRIISLILIQTFLVLDICWAAAGQAIIHNLNETTLSPSLTINNVDFQALINKVDDDEFDLDFEEGIDLVEDVDSDEVAKEVELESEMSAFKKINGANSSISSNNLGANNVSVDGGVGSDSPYNHGDIEIPPPDEIVANEAVGNVQGVYIVNGEDLDYQHEITNQELMDDYGLALADIGFKQKLIDKLVQENSSYFERAIWTLPQLLAKDELNRAAQGPFRILTNTRAQNAVDLAASGLAIGLPVEQIYGKMLTIFNFDRKLLLERSKDIVHVLYKTVSIINARKGIELADVYTLATKLVTDLRQIGIEAIDEGPNRRRTIGVRPHHIPVLRAEYSKNPQNMINYLKYMVLLHEEGHTLPMGVLAHQLKWTEFKTKETALRIFKIIMLGDWPKELTKMQFSPILDESQYRTQADVIMQSQWLYGYNPLKKDFRDAYWKEGIANYYAYLKLVDKENGDDTFAVELLAISTHYGIQLNPPEAEYLEVSLEDTINSFFPFLDQEQSIRWKKKVLELQAKDGVLSQEASKLLEKTNIGDMSTSGIGQNMFSLAAPVVFTSVLNNQAAMPNLGDGTAWVIAAGIAAVVTVSVWLWKATPFFKSVEKRTAQLVKKAINKKDPSGLMKYYQAANISDKVKIVNIATQEVKSSKKSDKVNLEIFENFFLDALNDQASNVFQGIQNDVKSLFEQRIDLGINVREMQAILNEVESETGLNLHRGNSVPVEPKLMDIINILGRDNDLNVDSFVEAVEKDWDLDLSIDRVLVSEFVRKATLGHQELGNSAKSLKIVISDYNDKYNLGINVDQAAAQAADTFKDFSLNEVEKTVALLRNSSFMNTFIQPQRNAQIRILFSAIIKNMIINRETQNASFSKIIDKALKQVLPGDPTLGNSMSPDIAILVSRLALEGNLHDQAVFVKQAESIAPIAKVMNAEQLRALHNAIVTLLESGYKDPVNTKLELVAAEFDKAGISYKYGTLNTGLAAVIIGSTNGNNIKLMDTPLAEIGEKVKASALENQIIGHHLFSNFTEADQEKVKQIIINLDSTLINNMVIGLVFESVNSLVAKHLDSLDLKNINKQRAQLVLVNTFSKGALLDDLQIVEAVEFNNAVETKVDKLRYAAAVGLRTITDVGFGTGPMVKQVEAYLNSVSNISTDLRTNLEAVTRVKVTTQRKVSKLAETMKALEQGRILRQEFIVTEKDTLISSLTESRNKAVQAIKDQISGFSFKSNDLSMQFFGRKTKSIDSAI